MIGFHNASNALRNRLVLINTKWRAYYFNPDVGRWLGPGAAFGERVMILRIGRTAAGMVWILFLASLSLGPAPVAAQTGSDSSMLPEPVRQKIEVLLEEAEEDLANGRLGGPGGDNAISRYHEIEALDPGNASAYEGLRRIAARALELASDALTMDDHLQAAEFLEIALQAGAKGKKVVALKKKIKKAPAQTQAKAEVPTKGTKATAPPVTTARIKIEDQGPTPTVTPVATTLPVASSGTAYERALNGERHLRRALEALVDGNREEARWNLDQARQMIPDDPGIGKLEKRLAALEGDQLRQAEQKLDQAEMLLRAGQYLDAEALVDEAAAILGWGGRVALLKNRIREGKPGQKPSSQPEQTGAGVTNSFGMKFNLIPAGRFLMGSNVETLTRPDELPYHEVRISKPFWMGLTEVTQGQWTAVMGDNPSRFVDNKGLRPVEQISYGDVMEFLKRLNEKDKNLIYRLPTEAEWEYACRARTSSQYYFGDDPKQLIKYGWFVGCSGFRTRAVGLKKANAWGLHDTHGNVWELCSDWYSPGYYRISPERDPKGPEKGDKRVIRGGCFLDGPITLRSAHRGTFRKSFRVGFRVAAEMK